jgi:hypothetical protein
MAGGEAVLAREHHQLHQQLVEGRTPGPTDHARPHLGRPHSLAWLRRQAHLRLVRGGVRVLVRVRRMGPAARKARAMEGLVAQPRGKVLLLPWQGQHSIPHHHLACHDHGLLGGASADRKDRAAAQPSLQCPRERILDALGPTVQQEPRHRHSVARHPFEVRPGHGPLLPERQHARGQGRRLVLGRFRRENQR